MKRCLAPEYVRVTIPSPYSVEAGDTKDGAMGSGQRKAAGNNAMCSAGENSHRQGLTCKASPIKTVFDSYPGQYPHPNRMSNIQVQYTIST